MKKWMIGIGLALVLGMSATNDITNNNTFAYQEGDDCMSPSRMELVAYQEGGGLMSPIKTKLVAYQEGGGLMSSTKTKLVAYQEGGDLMSPLIPIA